MKLNQFRVYTYFIT